MTRPPRLTLTLLLLAVPPAVAQLATPPAPPVQPHTQPRAFLMRVPHAEAGSDLGIVPSGTWWRYPETIRDLTLTPDQQHKMDDILRNNRIQLIDLKASLEKEQLNLEPILNTNPPDTGRAYTQIAHIADLRADLEKANAKMLLGLRALLTADQWTRLQAHHPGMQFSYDNGQTWQSRLGPTVTPNITTTCNKLFNNSARDCSITTVNTKRESGQTVTTTCISTAAQTTPKCTVSSSAGMPQSFFMAVPTPPYTTPPASSFLKVPALSPTPTPAIITTP